MRLDRTIFSILRIFDLEFACRQAQHSARVRVVHDRLLRGVIFEHAVVAESAAPADVVRHHDAALIDFGGQLRQVAALPEVEGLFGCERSVRIVELDRKSIVADLLREQRLIQIHGRLLLAFELVAQRRRHDPSAGRIHDVERLLGSFFELRQHPALDRSASAIRQHDLRDTRVDGDRRFSGRLGRSDWFGRGNWLGGGGRRLRGGSGGRGTRTGRTRGAFLLRRRRLNGRLVEILGDGQHHHHEEEEHQEAALHGELLLLRLQRIRQCRISHMSAGCSPSS